MTNFEKYVQSLTEEKFIDSMILNCDGCPACPCLENMKGYRNVWFCREQLSKWCEAEDE